MPTINAGQSQDFFLSATDGLFVTCTGVAKVSYENEILASAGSVSASDGEVRIGYFGVSMGLTISALSGTCTVNTSPSVMEPLTARQAGDANDSSPLDLKLSVNGLQDGSVGFDSITLKGLPQTAGSPAGYGDLATVIGQVARAQQQQSVILFGDSFAESFSFSPAPYNGDQLSISLYRFVIGGFGNSLKVTRNAGVSGNTAAMMLARYAADVTPHKANWVFFNVGVNDFFGLGFTADTVFAQVQQLLGLMLSEGRKVLMTNCPPQVTTRSNYTAGRATQCALYNKLIAEHVKTLNGVVMVDVYSPLVNWSDTTTAGALPQFFGSDGIHLSVLGTIQCANLIKTALAPHVAVNLSQPLSPLDTGLGGSECILIGTAGTNSTGSTGQVATGWTSRRVSGTNGDVVCSKLLPVGQRQTITLIATNGDSRYRLNNDLGTELAAHIGKTVTATIRGRCRTLSGGAHLKELVLKLYTFDGTTIIQAVNGNAYAGYSPLADSTFDTGEFVVTLRDLQIPTPLSGSGIYAELLLNSVAGGVVELDIYGVEIREVTP